ncbi:MAG: thiamine-phosphate kinase [Deltaproteobacteria bacterium]|nr:thiamine-phosphate kinase [Deltaproteobacteria bacterium]
MRRFGSAAASGAARGARPPVRLGIGDDAALIALPPGRELAITTDTALEGVDFALDRFPAEAIGWRCLAQNLSDLAAMGASPIGFVLTAAARPQTPLKTIDGLCRGMARLARDARCPLIGGDLSATAGPLTIAIAALGELPARTAHRRAGARPGDRLWVSGRLGDSAVALDWLLDGRPRRPATMAQALRRAPPALRPALRTYLQPRPRLALGRALRGVASAVIDISDGLVVDLRRLARASGVAVEVDAAALPLGAGAAATAALTSGEEYELLFTAAAAGTAAVRRAARRAGVAVTCIGAVGRGRGVRIDGRPASDRGGFDHFGRAAAFDFAAACHYARRVEGRPR